MLSVCVVSFVFDVLCLFCSLVSAFRFGLIVVAWFCLFVLLCLCFVVVSAWVFCYLVCVVVGLDFNFLFGCFWVLVCLLIAFDMMFAWLVCWCY